MIKQLIVTFATKAWKEGLREILIGFATVAVLCVPASIIGSLTDGLLLPIENKDTVCGNVFIFVGAALSYCMCLVAIGVVLYALFCVWEWTCEVFYEAKAAAKKEASK